VPVQMDGGVRQELGDVGHSPCLADGAGPLKRRGAGARVYVRVRPITLYCPTGEIRVGEDGSVSACRCAASAVLRTGRCRIS
jgi:hypothetical protein